MIYVQAKHFYTCHNRGGDGGGGKVNEGMQGWDIKYRRGHESKSNKLAVAEHAMDEMHLITAMHTGGMAYQVKDKESKQRLV